MSDSQNPRDTVLVTVTGKDAPGITARLTGLLAEAGAALLDIEQVVVRGQLTLCLLVRLPEARGVLKELLFAARELGVSLDFQPVDAPPAAAVPSRHVVTVVGRSLGARELHAVAERLAHHGANIERVHRLSESRRSSSARCWSWPCPPTPSTWRSSARASIGAASGWW
jgi:phosphoserine phosphatase